MLAEKRPGYYIYKKKGDLKGEKSEAFGGKKIFIILNCIIKKSVIKSLEMGKLLCIFQDFEAGI